MGVKRWFAAIFVTALIVALLVVLFFQSGADDRLVSSLLPKVEQRLGVHISYQDLDASLTAVTAEGIEISPSPDESPYLVIDRLIVNVRLGPLLFGDLEITGLKLDGLEIRVGSGANGASLAQWMELIKKLDGGKKAAPTGEPKSKRPEIYISSSRLRLDDSRFKLHASGMSGWVNPDLRTLLNVQEYEISHQGQKLLKGQSAKFGFQPDTRNAELDLESPTFEFVASRTRMLSLARDARALFSNFGEPTEAGPAPEETETVSDSDSESESNSDSDPDPDAGPENEAPVQSEQDTWLARLMDSVHIELSATEASGVVVNAEDPRSRVEIERVTFDATTTNKKEISLRSNGSLPGTNAQWGLGATIPMVGPPVITLEIPDLPLTVMESAFSASPHIKLDNATADVTVKVEIQKGGQEMSATGQAAVSGLELIHERLSPDPLEDLRAHSDFKLTYDRTENVVHLERFLVSRGLARMTIRGDVHLDRTAFDLSVQVPPTACRQIFNAVPPALRTRLEDVVLEGRFSLDLRLALDVADPEATVLEADMDNQCTIANLGHIPTPDYFRGAFSYVAYTAEGEDLKLVTGPGTDRWSPLMSISPYLVEALLTTEDGKFWHHKGMTLPEVRRAIELNLKKDALRHGASTITMQLAKNLFLSRDRTLARKLQELFFVWYLESNFTKEEILELYFNIVEFGPSIYGISDAAFHYFGREPIELHALESVFLIRRLPSPVSRHRSWEKNTISDRGLASLHRVLKRMKERDRLTPVEYEDALKQEIVFYREGDPLPMHRSPIYRLAPGDSAFGPSEQELDELRQPEPTDPPF